MFKKADALIAKFGGMVEVNFPPSSRDRFERVGQASQVLTQLSAQMPQQASKFLMVMEQACKDFGINSGMRHTPAPGQRQDAALNADAFKGVDVNNNLYAQARDAIFSEFKEEAAKETGAQPTGEDTSTVQTGATEGDNTAILEEKIAALQSRVGKGNAVQGVGTLTKAEVDAA